MIYTVKIKSTAYKELDRLPTNIIERVTDIVNTLSFEQRPRGCVKLVGATNLWRIRIGDYRIIYEINDFQKVINVRRILHRKEAYR